MMTLNKKDIVKVELAKRNKTYSKLSRSIKKAYKTHLAKNRLENNIKDLGYSKGLYKTHNKVKINHKILKESKSITTKSGEIEYYRVSKRNRANIKLNRETWTISKSGKDCFKVRGLGAKVIRELIAVSK